LLHDFGRQLLVGQKGALLELFIQFGIADIAPFMNIGLPHSIIRRVVDILGGKTGGVDSLPQRVIATDEVLFDKLDRLSHSPAAPL
jgi:hypothetical protein